VDDEEMKEVRMAEAKAKCGVPPLPLDYAIEVIRVVPGFMAWLGQM
jgi:hypothetical protein